MAVSKELLDRFEVKLTVPGIGTYGDRMQPSTIEVQMTDELKAALVEALDLGANCRDEERQTMTLLLASVRHGSGVNA